MADNDVHDSMPHRRVPGCKQQAVSSMVNRVQQTCTLVSYTAPYLASTSLATALSNHACCRNSGLPASKQRLLCISYLSALQTCCLANGP